MTYSSLQITGSHLNGTITPPGSLAESLFMMSLALLAPGSYRLTTNCEAEEVSQMGQLLRQYGVTVQETRRYFIDLASQQQHFCQPDFLLSHNLPAALFCLVPSVINFGEAAIFLPDFSHQPAWFENQLLSLLTSFGLRPILRGGLLTIKSRQLKGADITLPPDDFLLSCLALQSAVLAEGDSTIIGVATSDEFVACCRALQKMGAMIENVGTRCLLIHGVNALAPMDFTISTDNRQLLALFWAGLLTNGQVTFSGLNNCNIQMLHTLAEKIGLSYQSQQDTFRLENNKFELPGTIYIDSAYPDLEIPAIILLAAQRLHNFHIISNQLPQLMPDLMILQRCGLRLAEHSGSLLVTAPRVFEPFTAWAENSQQALWFIWAALAASGQSTIYNGAITARHFTNLELQINRLDGQIAIISAEAPHE